jgi:hypothetical protein
MFPNCHEHIDRANLEHDRATAAALRRHPELIQVARDNLTRWMARDGDTVHSALAEWVDILFFLRPDQLAAFIESETPKANRLRQSSPFIGILRRAAQLEAVPHAAPAA